MKHSKVEERRAGHSRVGQSRLWLTENIDIKWQSTKMMKKKHSTRAYLHVSVGGECSMVQGRLKNGPMVSMLYRE